MFRCIMARRLLKSVKTRFLGTKHERNPSTLHDYLDLENPLPKKVYWRSWFPIFIVVPLVYYLIMATTGYGIQYAAIRPEPDQEKESFNSIRYSTALFLLHNDTHSHNLLPLKTDHQEQASSDKNFLARQPVQHERNADFSFDQRQGRKKSQPFCPTNQVISYEELQRREKIKRDGTNSPIYSYYDLKTVVEYRSRLTKGGYFESTVCRARHRVAIVVPYRDRERNLAVFLYVMHPFLIEQGLEYRIFVIEQSGKELFNRGRLFNVGFLEAKKHGSWGCMAFHDVDLLPTTDKIKYTCPTWPRHMCGSIVGRPETAKYKSHYGGVTMMTPKHYEKVNGYSNWYWGWGGEDTDMFWRIKNSGLALTRYSKTVAVYKAMPHKKNPENPIKEILIKSAGSRYKTDGLSKCRYKVLSTTLYHTYTHILVDINPDKENITEFQLQWQ